MVVRRVGRTLVPVLNVTALALLYAALLASPRRVFTLSRIGLDVCAGIPVLGAFSLLSGTVRGALARGARRVGAGGRAVLIVAPSVVVILTLATTGLWWLQRPWGMKLFAIYVFANWSIFWCVAPIGPAGSPQSHQTARAGPDPDSMTRRALAGVAVMIGALGAEGLVFGVTPFGVAASAFLACCAFALAWTAGYAGRTVRSNVLALALGTVLGLVCVEAGIRLLHLGDRLQEVDNLDYVRQFHHITPPRSTFVNWPGPLDEFGPALVETNSLGIRGPEIPTGRVDVLLLGDSMVEARQLPWDETLGPRLEAALRARSAPARVVAYGMRGWSPLLEWNWYLKVGRGLHPRTVFLFFFWNDLWVTGTEAQTYQAVLRPDGRPDHFDVIVEPQWVWFKHVQAIRLAEDVTQRVGIEAVRRAFSFVRERRPGQDLKSALELARRLAGDTLVTPDEVNLLLTQPVSRLDSKLQQVAGSMFWPSVRPLTLWTDEQRRAADVTELELKRFAEDAAADGARLVLVYVPNAYQIAPSECSVSRYLNALGDGVLLPPDSGIQGWLRAAAERDGIDLIDPTDAMRAFHREQPADDTPLYLRADCHWSERGHQFMADYLADWLLGRHAPVR